MEATRFLRSAARTLALLALLLASAPFLSCSGGGGAGSGPAACTLTLDFTRQDSAGLDPFTVTAHLSRDGAPLPGAALSILVGRPSASSVPSLSAVTDLGAGSYQFTVTPDQTGEHPVTVSYENCSISRTPLVLDDVEAGWEQPMAVPGYANTEGYEDGVTVSPDGEYLFVQTGPMYFSGLLQSSIDCGGSRAVEPCASSVWGNRTRGSYAAPERPGFFTGRIDTTDGSLRHNSNLWQLPDDGAPFLAPITLFYGFKRQADGSFQEPFLLGFDDLDDAIINPFGMSFRMNGDGTATMIFALQDTATAGFDIYTTDVTLGQHNSLGTYLTGTNPGDPPVRDAAHFASRPVALGATAGTQGNPHLFTLPGGTVHSIWTDDEYDSVVDAYGDFHDLSVYTLESGTFPDGTWTRFTLPAKINDGSDQIQPFFAGDGLFYTQGTEIFRAAYSGGTFARTDLENSASWGTPVRVLAKDTSYAIGSIVAIGEPTIARYQGAEYLYFVYGYVRGREQAYVDAGYVMVYDLDMQAGFVRKR